MADNRKGVWDLQLVRDERLQGDWTYDADQDLKLPSELFASGDNATYGGLGQNDIIPRSSPVQVPGTQWIGLNSGRYSDKVAWKNDNTM